MSDDECRAGLALERMFLYCSFFANEESARRGTMAAAGEGVRECGAEAGRRGTPDPGPGRFHVTLVVVPPGGGEAECCLLVEVPALPREGDYVTVMRNRERPVARKHIGTEDFIVRRVWWAFDYPDDGRLREDHDDRIVGTVNGIGIECEPARGHYSSDAHLRACGPRARSFEPSAY
jgi:hypothetical protein